MIAFLSSSYLSSLRWPPRSHHNDKGTPGREPRSICQRTNHGSSNPQTRSEAVEMVCETRHQKHFNHSLIRNKRLCKFHTHPRVESLDPRRRHSSEMRWSADSNHSNDLALAFQYGRVLDQNGRANRIACTRTVRLCPSATCGSSLSGGFRIKLKLLWLVLVLRYPQLLLKKDDMQLLRPVHANHQGQLDVCGSAGPSDKRDSAAQVSTCTFAT